MGHICPELTLCIIRIIRLLLQFDQALPVPVILQFGRVQFIKSINMTLNWI